MKKFFKKIKKTFKKVVKTEVFWLVLLEIFKLFLETC
jgi:uncharacterized membrane protein (DUF373 family)